MYQLFKEDAISLLKRQVDGSIDMICTDIPYESLEKHRKVGTTTRLTHSEGSSNDWFPIFKNESIPGLLKEFYRVLKNGSDLYFFADNETMFIVYPMLLAAGFEYRNIIIWDKCAIGMGYSFRKLHENVMFFCKGKRKKLNDLSIPDVLSFKRIRNGYPTEKPLGLLEVLVKQSTQPGELVMDPFMGSGVCGEASVMHGRNFIGCDVEEKAIQYAKERIEKTILPIDATTAPK